MQPERLVDHDLQVPLQKYYELWWVWKPLPTTGVTAEWTKFIGGDPVLMDESVCFRAFDNEILVNQPEWEKQQDEARQRIIVWQPINPTATNASSHQLTHMNRLSKYSSC